MSIGSAPGDPASVHIASLRAPATGRRTAGLGAVRCVAASAALLRRLGLLVLLSLGFAANAAHARDVRVGVYENAPKIYTDAKGIPRGLFIDITEAVAQEEGWTLVYVPCAWDGCMAMLERGDIDLMPDVAISENRKKRFSFNRIGVLHGWTDVVIAGNRTLHEFEELAGLRVAVLDASIQQAKLRQLMDARELTYVEIPVRSLDAGFRLVQQGQVDAAVSNNFFTDVNAARYGLLESPVLLEPVMFYFAAPAGKNSDLLARIDAHLGPWKIDPDSPLFDAMGKALVSRQAEGGLSESQQRALISLGVLGGVWILALRWQVRKKTSQLTTSNAKLNHLLDAVPVVLYQVEGWD